MNQPTGPTGPRTEEGKSISSRNATKHGFYAERNYVLPDEEDEFATRHDALMTELSPEGLLEQVHADEIMTATWRLRRCGIVEASFANVPEPDEKLQRAVDRARAHSHNIIRRSGAELRRLQTELSEDARADAAGGTAGRAVRVHRDAGKADADGTGGDSLPRVAKEPAAHGAAHDFACEQRSVALHFDIEVVFEGQVDDIVGRQIKVARADELAEPRRIGEIDRRDMTLAVGIREPTHRSVGGVDADGGVRVSALRPRRRGESERQEECACLLRFSTHSYIINDLHLLNT